MMAIFACGFECGCTTMSLFIVDRTHKIALERPRFCGRHGMHVVEGGILGTILFFGYK